MGNNLILAFLVALQFLTTIPVRYKQVTEQRIGQSLLFYPLIGLIQGVILYLLMSVLPTSHSFVSAALLLFVWIVLTGGLHLDGLADSADAWLGGIGGKERTLTIMKDPASGPIAVATIVMLLLLKFTLLEVIVSEANVQALIWPLILARMAMPLLFMTTAYVRNDGLGAVLKAYMPIKASKWVLAITSAIALFTIGWLPLLLGSIVFLYLRYLMQQRLDGFTGDTAGAMVELLEVSFLILLIIL